MLIILKIAPKIEIIANIHKKIEKKKSILLKDVKLINEINNVKGHREHANISVFTIQQHILYIYSLFIINMFN